MNTLFFVDNITAPVFSLAISRDQSQTSHGGILAIGGIPDCTESTVNVSSSAQFSTVPMEIAQAQRLDPETPEHQFYVITADSLAYGGPNNTSNSTQYIVDSGTPLNYIPVADAAAINALYDPPAVADPEAGSYLVQCNATAPEFGVTIGGQTFYTNPYDMFAPDPSLPDGTCISALQPEAAAGRYVLGATFFKNVLAVFDVGNLTMQFASRVDYES
jgi:hypothetical protein